MKVREAGRRGKEGEKVKKEEGKVHMDTQRYKETIRGKRPTLG